MEIINFKVEHQCIVADRQSFVSDTIGSYTCHFDFDEQWEGLNKVAVFVKGQTAVQIVLNENNECPFADELLDTTGNICIGVYGTKEGVRYPTVKTKVLVIHEGIVDGTQPTPPTEEIWEQLLNMIVAETERATSKEDELNDDIVSERQRAIAKENALQSEINTKAERANTYTKGEVDHKISQLGGSISQLSEDLQNEVNTRQEQYNEVTDDIENINKVIPSDASNVNQLVTKDFVNSSISTNTAYFIGTFNSVEELEAYEGTKTNNDYAFVQYTEQGIVTKYERFKWNGSEWLFEYELNNSSFTDSQWNAINSGINSTLVEQISTNENNIETLFQAMDSKMEFYEVTLEDNQIVKDGVVQTYSQLKSVFDSPKYWLYLKVSGVCFLPLGKLNADLEHVLQFNTQYDFDDGMRYERIEITENNVVTTLFKHFEITENKASSISGRNKTSEVKYPSVKAVVDYIDGQDFANNTDLASVREIANEADSIAKGANKALSYGDYETLVISLNSMAKDSLNLGQSIMIVTLEVPDLWVSKIEDLSVTYEYVDDETFVNELKTNGSIQIGYYKVSALETQKTDLSNYVKFTDYASDSKVGVIRTSDTTKISTNSQGILTAKTILYDNYTNANNVMFIGKGTLENVLDNETPRVDKSQSFTDAQKKQARENIGALEGFQVMHIEEYEALIDKNGLFAVWSD